MREVAPADPDAATARTVQLMCDYIRGSARDPILRAAARAAVDQYKMGGPLWAIAGKNPFADPATRPQALAEAVWWYARHHLTFKHHQKQIVAWFGEHEHLQLLISPDVLLRFPFRMEGDCAIYTMLICAMLEVLGVEWEIDTVAWDRNQPNVFLHVYPRAVLPGGSRLALDASHGKYPGWSIPLSERTRNAVWGSDGEQVSDAGEGRFTGLQGYMRGRGFGYYRGLGDDSGDVIGDTGGTIIPAPPPVDTTLSDWQALVGSATIGGSDANTPAVTSVNGTSGIVAPSQSSAAWPTFLSQLAKGGMTLAEINAIQPGTVVSANGAILRQATGLPVPVGTTGSITAALGSVSSGTLLLAGVAVVALLFLGKK